MNPVAEIKNLQVIYGGKAVLDVTHLAVAKGEILTVIGPNGSGKSTLLRVLALLEKPSRGEVFLSGERIDRKGNLLRYRRRLSIVLQQALLRNASTFENVATGLRFRGAFSPEARQKVNHWLNRLGIAHLGERNARTLSGGEAQRASLARALVLEPDLLLLDEPFAALDAPSRTSLIDDLRDIWNEVKVTTVFVTHDRTEALAFGHRVAVMVDGRILQVDVAERVFNSPQNEAVAAFVGVENILPGYVQRQENGLAVVQVHNTGIAVVGDYKMGEEVIACIRPEDVVLESVSNRSPLSSARNKLRGRVTKSMSLGPQLRVVVDCGFPVVSLVTKQSFSEMSLAEGVEVVASFKASAVHVIRRRVS